MRVKVKAFGVSGLWVRAVRFKPRVVYVHRCMKPAMQLEYEHACTCFLLPRPWRALQAKAVHCKLVAWVGGQASTSPRKSRSGALLPLFGGGGVLRTPCDWRQQH